MKISVVTPSFNQGEFIEHCIVSVLDQQYPEVEHIIVDNCSTDGTHELLNKYPHLNCIIEKDSGQSNALNKGIQAANGDWILWLNADDYMLPNVFHLLNGLSPLPDHIHMVYGHVQMVDETGRPLKTVYHIPYRYFLTFFNAYIPPSTGNFFRSSFLKEHLLDEEYHYIMDVEWMFRCGKEIRTKCLSEIISAFRVSCTNKTGSQITDNIIQPRYAEEREVNRQRYIITKLTPFGFAGKFAYKGMHWLAVMYFKIVKLFMLLQYRVVGSQLDRVK